MSVDDKSHDIGIACPLPGGLRHGAVEPPLRLKDSRRIDKDDLAPADERDAAHGPACRLCLVGDDTGPAMANSMMLSLGTRRTGHEARHQAFLEICGRGHHASEGEWDA